MSNTFQKHQNTEKIIKIFINLPFTSQFKRNVQYKHLTSKREIQTGNMSNVLKLYELCGHIIKDPEESSKALKELRGLIIDSNLQLVGHFRKVLLPALYNFIKEPDKFKTEVKEEAVNVLTEIFNGSETDSAIVYFNISGFLLNEVYNWRRESIVKDVYEEHKLAVMKCLIALNKSVSTDILMEIYTKENTPRFTHLIYACIGLAKSEKLRSLRIAAMECILTMARLHVEMDNSDVVLYSAIADIFMFYLPGLSSGLCKVCMEDEKIGHKVIKIAVQTWGRLVNLLMKNYEPITEEIDFNNFHLLVNNHTPTISATRDTKWKNSEEIKEYINSNTRTREWYKKVDLKLFEMADVFQNLCSNSHKLVRSELADLSLLLLENCKRTMPRTLSKFVIILITLSEDADDGISRKCRTALNNLSREISTTHLKHLLDYLEEDFYKLLTSIPRTFNGLDNQKKLSSLNLLIGYINLFGKYELITVLHSTTHLHKLIESLLYISELDKVDVQLLDEWIIQDFDTNPDLRTPWKKYVHFTDDDLILKLTQLCQLLSQDVIVDIIVDCLLEVYEGDRKKESILLLNEILTAKSENDNTETIKSIIDLFLEPSSWNVPTTPTENNLAKIHDDVIRLCLQLEGIGKMALLLQDKFKDLLLKTLYPIIEKAGSGQPLLKTAGLSAIANISIACRYKSVTDLINNNSDYFSYHVTRKLRRLNENEQVLNVLGVVMNHCSMDVLPSIGDIVHDVLYQSRDCTNKNCGAFMRVFNIFTKCLLRWLDIKVVLQPIKSKAEKEREARHFEVANLEEERDFCDDVLEKSAEEMYEEDRKKTKEELDDEIYPEDKYKKPEPPQHIKLTVSILKRILHFLPSKNKEVKILSLEILKNGLEIIRDWEDDLLPIVHQIWSPLVNRFKDDKEPLIFNLSFQLLIALARLSKDFIRSRTVKDVLPSILDTMRGLSKESYLKDRGSAYRYTQGYKLQTVVLEEIARLIIDLEMDNKHVRMCMETLKVYLSDKQPLPLRNQCVAFYKTLALYDEESVTDFINTLEARTEYQKTLLLIKNT